MISAVADPGEEHFTPKKVYEIFKILRFFQDFRDF